MNKHFTEEYIDEANCKEIQKLKPKLKIGDWIQYSDDEILFVGLIYFISKEKNKIYYSSTTETGFGATRFRKDFIWLPTGDQLDEEIRKICKENEYNYETSCSYINNYGLIVAITGMDIVTKEMDSNPLIAKIKLLKELLNENL